MKKQPNNSHMTKRSSIYIYKYNSQLMTNTMHYEQPSSFCVAKILSRYLVQHRPSPSSLVKCAETAERKAPLSSWITLPRSGLHKLSRAHIHWELCFFFLKTFRSGFGLVERQVAAHMRISIASVSELLNILSGAFGSSEAPKTGRKQEELEN